MEPSRQLMTYLEAMKLSGVPRRTFFTRLKDRDIAVFTDPDDRRRRWILRSDVAKLTERQQRRKVAA